MKSSAQYYLESLGPLKIYSKKDELQLIYNIKHKNCKKSLNNLILSIQPAIIKVCLEYKNSNIDIMDLIMEGNSKLLYIIKKNINSKSATTLGNAFKSFIALNVFRIIQNYVKESMSLIRISSNKVDETIEHYYKKTPEFHLNTTTTEYLDDTYIKIMTANKERIEEIENRDNAPIVSWCKKDDKYIINTDSIDYYNLTIKYPLLYIDEDIQNILSYNNSQPDKELETISFEEEVINTIDTLKEREKDIIKLYFGIDREYSLTLSEIGEEFKLTRERIRQIKEKAIRRLRHKSRSKKLKEFLNRQVTIPLSTDLRDLKINYSYPINDGLKIPIKTSEQLNDYKLLNAFADQTRRRTGPIRNMSKSCRNIILDFLKQANNPKNEKKDINDMSIEELTIYRKNMELTSNELMNQWVKISKIKRHIKNTNKNIPESIIDYSIKFLIGKKIVEKRNDSLRLKK